jgi:hypothetical protein
MSNVSVNVSDDGGGGGGGSYTNFEKPNAFVTPWCPTVVPLYSPDPIPALQPEFGDTFEINFTLDNVKYVLDF